MNGTDKRKQESYARMVERHSPDSEMGGSMARAFAVGGLICCIGQAITDICTNVYGFDKELAGGTTSILLILIAALLTGLGVYDRIGKFAGAGSIVPITGFSNSIVAPAMEYRAEGIVLGIGAKLFTLAGPVLVNGIAASVVIGLLYLILGV